MHAELRRGGDDERTDVERGIRLGRDPVLFDFDQRLDGGEEVFLRNLRDAQTLGGAVETAGVFDRAEEQDFALFIAVGLHALKNLLCVVEDDRCRRELKIGEGNNARIVPALPLVIVHEEHVIGKILAERNTVS